MKKLISVLVLIFLVTAISAQRGIPENTQMVNGFSQKISGDDFSYHSSIQFARECLLIRATDGNSSMEWVTEPTTLTGGRKSATFVWLAGIGSSPGKASFDLEVNGTPKFTFWADGSDEWSLTAADGSVLSFQKDMTDQHGDRFGFMFLTIPAEHLNPGEALRLKVTGGNSGKTSWYMTFKFPLQNGLNFKALPAIVSGGGKQHQLGVAGILHFGPPSVAKIWIGRNLIREAPVEFGYNYVKVDLPSVTKNTQVNYRMEIAGNSWQGKLALSPVRNWRVNFVQHTHTDIGYTRSQTEILGEHLRFIDYALDYCDMTDRLSGGGEISVDLRGFLGCG
jgi:alpha-mannosidase